MIDSRTITFLVQAGIEFRLEYQKIDDTSACTSMYTFMFDWLSDAKVFNAFLIAIGYKPCFRQDHNEIEVRA